MLRLRIIDALCPIRELPVRNPSNPGCFRIGDSKSLDQPKHAGRSPAVAFALSQALAIIRRVDADAPSQPGTSERHIHSGQQLPPPSTVGALEAPQFR